MVTKSTNYHEFYLRNTSTSPIKLKLKAQLTAATGDWGTLSPVISAWIGDNTGTTGSGWHTFADWNTSTQNITITLNQGETKLMRMYISIPSTAGNTIADKTTATTWVFTGDQVYP